MTERTPHKSPDRQAAPPANVAARGEPIRLRVNGAAVESPAVEADTPLLWVLRDPLALKGTKYGCGQGVCGGCTVQIDGKAKPSCMLPVGELAGRSVTTIEALAVGPEQPVIRAWLAEQVPQCGYCQPGMIMAAAALLERKSAPGDTASSLPRRAL
jgi:isoquinoline 1-oxidoreductase alpha subunit